MGFVCMKKSIHSAIGGFGKGQVANEGLMAVIIVILIFTLVSAAIFSSDFSASETRDNLKDRRECTKLSNGVYSVFSLGPNSNGSVRLLESVNVSGGFLYVNDYLCRVCCNFTSNGTSAFNLVPGTYTLSYSTGGVQILGGEPGDSGPSNTTVFFDNFESWTSSDCGHPGNWNICNKGDGELRRNSDSHAGTYSIRFTDHDADTDELTKCVDLSQYNKSYVSFWWKKSGLDSGEYGKLEINTTSSGFAEVFNSGTGSSSYAEKLIDITSYISSNTCLKFHVLANAGVDQFFVDSFTILGESS